MASNPPPANLPCAQCGYVNEAERVYCHNCGSKLDRSILPTHEEQGEDSPDKARKRISKLTNPKSGFILEEIKTFLKVELSAVIVAALYLIAQKPEGVPEQKKESIQRMVNSDMMEAMQAAQPTMISFTEDDVNPYLKRTVKPQETMMPGVEVSRVYAQFFPGVIRMGTENSLFGYPIYIEIAVRPEVKDRKFTTTVVGGSLGHLAVDPRLMQYADFLFQGSWDALKRERGQMDRMEKVEVRKGSITLVTKGAGR